MDWKVLTVRWYADSSALVAWYFDILEAEKGKISEEGKVYAIESGAAFDCPDISRLCEIRQWVSGWAWG